MKTNTIENTTGKRRRDNTWALGEGLNMICLLNVLQLDSTSAPFSFAQTFLFVSLGQSRINGFFTTKLHVGSVLKI